MLSGLEQALLVTETLGKKIQVKLYDIKSEWMSSKSCIRKKIFLFLDNWKQLVEVNGRISDRNIERELK